MAKKGQFSRPFHGISKNIVDKMGFLPHVRLKNQSLLRFSFNLLILLINLLS